MRYNDIQYIYIYTVYRTREDPLTGMGKIGPMFIKWSLTWGSLSYRFLVQATFSSSLHPQFFFDWTKFACYTTHTIFFWLNHVKLLNNTYFSIYFVVFVSGPIFMADNPVLNCGWGNVSPPTLHRLHSPPLWRSCLWVGPPGISWCMSTCHLDWTKQPMYYRYIIWLQYICGYNYSYICRYLLYMGICDYSYICRYLLYMWIYNYSGYIRIWCIIILIGPPYPNLWGMITMVISRKNLNPNCFA